MKMRGDNNDEQKKEIRSGQERRKTDKKVNALYRTILAFLMFLFTLLVIIVIGAIVIGNQMMSYNEVCSRQEGAYPVCTIGHTNLIVDCGECIKSVCSDTVITWHNCTVKTQW